MKRVLFVGDGKHDVGAPEWPTDQPYPARGVIPHLTERTTEIDRTHSRALRWSDIPRLLASKTGYLHKLRAAQLLAVRHGLDAVVAVVDQDNDPRAPGTRRSRQTGKPWVSPAVMGVAVRSIEAWTLGAPTALASTLGTTPAKLQAACPTCPIEQLYDGSGKPELRSKPLLDGLAKKFAHRPDSLELREQVAAITDINELCTHCPQGFARFAADLRASFGARATPL